MSDAQWCLENGIKPGTFYNWVNRLRKKACYDVPEPCGRNFSAPMSKQDVVRIDITPDAGQEEMFSGTKEDRYVMEIVYGKKLIRITNDIAPQLLDAILEHEGGGGC